LSSQARRAFHAAEQAIHCERGAATTIAGPLEHVVTQLYAFFWESGSLPVAMNSSVPSQKCLDDIACNRTPGLGPFWSVLQIWAPS
jgi:hypothetical protein